MFSALYNCIMNFNYLNKLFYKEFNGKTLHNYFEKYQSILENLGSFKKTIYSLRKY